MPKTHDKQPALLYMTIEQGVAHVVGQLSTADVLYAGSPARGEFRGFAALHDRMDANMLLPGTCPGEDVEHEHSDAWCAFANRVMNEVTARIISTWREFTVCPQCHGETTVTLHVLEFNTKKVTSTDVLTCPTWNGDGRVSVTTLKALLEEEESWCDCGKTKHARYVPDGASTICPKHHWVCDHCGRIVQIG